MIWFVILGGALLILVMLAAATSRRARQRAAMVGTSPEEIQAKKVASRDRRAERAQDRGQSWG